MASDDEGPSSPDNTFSSPASLLRGGGRDGRQRGRSSTPASFAASDSTPPPSRPSASRSNVRNRRHPATPSSTDDVPPSSEAGEEDDADDATPTFVWGTNISVQDVRSAIQMFIKHFREAHESNDSIYAEGKYTAAIHKVLEIEGEWIDVDAHDVFDYDSDLYNKMVRYPLEVLAIFDIVLMDIVIGINPSFEKHVQVRIFNLKTSASMRHLNPSG